MFHQLTILTMLKSIKLLAIFLMSLYTVAHAQFSIKGTVRNQSGEALPAANIAISPINKLAVTDAEGQFSIGNLAEGTYNLKVSFVGFATYETSIDLNKNRFLIVELKEAALLKDQVIVYATRANEKTPTTYTDFSSEQIEDRNLGQDIPFLLNFTPSVVTTSDAGNGVGYTGIRIRGSDETRINVTINGIPVNDSESNGVFWVNMPDLASSLDNIQVQRGVGSSTNGASAFGATINMQTANLADEAFAQIDNSVGSFNTRKHTAIFNSGLLNDRWAFEGRVSQISSDGYIDRANSDLKSYFLTGAYKGEKTTIKAVVFGGKEVTYQSWYGTPEARLNNDVEGMEAVIANNGFSEAEAQNLLNSGRTFNFYLYDNQVDNYQQDHYQLHFGHEFNSTFNINAALHHTYGRGYYEQFRENDRLSNYNLPVLEIGNTTITRSDLIRRRWLDNNFTGVTYSANYSKNDLVATLGGAYNEYVGDHFGEIIWAQYAGAANIRDRYYDNVGKKTDFNIFLKTNYQLNNRLNIYGDLQYRGVTYQTNGIDNDLLAFDVDADFSFVNPKFGLTYTLDQNSSLYASYSIGNKEPVRNDFIDAPNGKVPTHETLRNVEAGFKKNGSKYSLQANFFLMDYKNQLVLTGALNDVGANIRTNTPNSYRTGIELAGSYQISKMLQWTANLTLSRNKIRDFEEVLYDYGVNFDDFIVVTNQFEDTDISFSPNVVAGSQLAFSPRENFTIQLLSKYVGSQFLDNTGDATRAINAYFVNDLKFDYQFKSKAMKHIKLSLLVNNILNHEYEANGYTFGYAGGGSTIRENYFYPQAGRNFLLALSLKF
jgi:iron complex outermembrane receptor protein